MKHFLIRSVWETAPKPLPGQMLFAVGDTHGYADLLKSLHAAITAEIKTANNAHVTLVRLGDFIDRGPDSMGVLDLAMQGIGLTGVNEINLKGNHEMYCYLSATDARAGFDFLSFWIENGGKQTLAELGITTEDLYHWSMDEVRERITAAFGPQRMAFLESLATTHRVGDYLCVHAGLAPERPLDDQNEYDMLTIRKPFLSPDAAWRHPVSVVHGHTISAPTVRDHRIGVDTGAYRSGALTAVQITEDRLRFLTVVNRKASFEDLKLRPDGDKRTYEKPIPIVA